MSEMKVIVFIQDNVTKEIHQTELLSYYTGKENIITENNIDIYPNPTTGILSISDIENTQINVYSILDELVISVNSGSYTKFINLTKSDKGTYIVKIEKENNIITNKVILTK